MTVTRLQTGVLGLCGRNTVQGAPAIPVRFPGSSWGGTFPSWRILLLHETSTPSALCFLAGRRWTWSSQGTQGCQRGQQCLSVGLDEEFRSMCFLCAPGGPAITEWLRVSESAARIYAHTFMCVGLDSSFGNVGTRLSFLSKQMHSSRSAGFYMIFT